ncbi:MAG: hypothetical protein ABSB32_22720 [Thermodesulfobacteriota bacterium]|jgi:hypothetical protein
MELKWAPILGELEQKDQTLIFKGGTTDFEGRPQIAIGNFLSDQMFSGGKILADVQFDAVDEYSACDIILFYEPSTRFFVTAGIGAVGSLYTIRHFRNQWVIHGQVGERKNLVAKRKYHLEVIVIGSNVSLRVEGIVVLSLCLPYQVPQSQVGVWCMSKSNIFISNYKVSTERPKAFVVMQFSEPYNELYQEVIHRICDEFKIDAKRADEVYGPGVIIADIVKQIVESKLIIAEITPANPNVYYEIGYAHALGKPTILIAEKATELPFDVSPFRVLFYENTIAGKKRIEDGLRRHLESILGRVV